MCIRDRITSEDSGSLVHSFRACFDAIIIGGNTLRKDDPLLTSRGIRKPEPLRVVFTKTLDLPEKSNLWDCNLARTLVVYDASSANKTYLKRIPEGVEIEELSSDNPILLSNLLAKKVVIMFSGNVDLSWQLQLLKQVVFKS